MRKIGLLVSLFIVLCITTVDAAYLDEYPESYTWAYKNGITTMDTMGKANMYGEITRIELSKMISNYAINILKKKPDTSKKCEFSDISDRLNLQYDSGVVNSCQLGLMGQGIMNFRPYDKVTRAEFGTILSRLLWGDKYNGGNPYYKKHINQLNIRGIMTNIKNLEKGKELRGNVMVMLKRSEKLGDIEIPSFEELNNLMDIKCEYENDFSGDHYFENLTKKDFILPYKDGYFGFSYGGQDGDGLYIYYRLIKNPCVTYLNSDEILWWPAGGQEMTKIYKDYDKNIIAKELNCKAGNYEGCYKEVEKYAYNLLIGAETNEYFSLRMDTLKRMVDNKEYDDQNEKGYYINRPEKHYDCYEYYSNKTDKTDNISEYCHYEIMGICPNADFCNELKPKLDSQFGGNNVIFGKKSRGGTRDIIGNKTYYHNEDYGITVLLGKEFSGGAVNDSNYDDEHSVLFTKYDRNNEDDELVGRRWESLVFIIRIFDKDKTIEYDKYPNASFIGKNNKYQFIKSTYDDSVDYVNINIFNVY